MSRSLSIKTNFFSVTDHTVTLNFTADEAPDKGTFSAEASISSPFQQTVQTTTTVDRHDTATWCRFTAPNLTATVSRMNMPTHIESLLRPYFELGDQVEIVLATSDGSDPEIGAWVGGFNAYLRAIPVARVPPFAQFPASWIAQLGLEDVTMDLYIASRSARDFVCEGRIRLGKELGVRTIVLESLAVAVSADTRELSAGASADLTLRLDQALALEGGVEASTSGSATLWGSLAANRGRWVDPFGLKGLTIGNMGAEISAVSTFPYVALGVRGEAYINGGSNLGAEIAVLLDPHAPDRNILSVYSEKGLDLRKLLGDLISNTISTAMVPNCSLERLQIYACPNGGEIANKPYEPGIALRGALDLWGWRAAVEGDLNYETGGSLLGEMDPLRLPATGTSFIEIAASRGRGGADLSLDFNTAKQGGLIRGRLTLLGNFSQSIDAELGANGFRVALSQDNMGIYGGAKIEFENGVFRTNVETGLQGIELDLGIETISFYVEVLIQIAASPSQWSQTLEFRYNVLGKRGSVPVNVSARIPDLDAILDIFNARARQEIANALTRYLLGGPAAAFAWFKNNISGNAERAVAYFKSMGADSTAIAKGISNEFGKTAGQATDMVASSAEQAAKILKSGFDKSAKGVAKHLKNEWKKGDKGVKSILKKANFSKDKVKKAMEDIFNWSSLDFITGWW